MANKTEIPSDFALDDDGRPDHQRIMARAHWNDYASDQAHEILHVLGYAKTFDLIEALANLIGYEARFEGQLDLIAAQAAHLAWEERKRNRS